MARVLWNDTQRRWVSISMSRQAVLAVTYVLLISVVPAAAQKARTDAPGGKAGSVEPPPTAPASSTPLSKADMRRRLSHCGSEWQKMKRSGADAGLIWRDFSALCIQRQ
ncbi:MAG: hypothetical protein JWM36_1491 [Hyphomicrobiales bacterium]|nr:hypothetical protein [Hyphomicrobiales bacterium]